MAFVFDFGFDSLEDPHGGREVIDSPGSFEGGGHDGDGGDEIVGEGVVEVSLKLEDILYAVEFLLVSRRKLLKSLLLVRAATASRRRTIRRRAICRRAICRRAIILRGTIR